MRELYGRERDAGEIYLYFQETFRLGGKSTWIMTELDCLSVNIPLSRFSGLFLSVFVLFIFLSRRYEEFEQQ